MPSIAFVYQKKFKLFFSFQKRNQLPKKFECCTFCVGNSPGSKNEARDRVVLGTTTTVGPANISHLKGTVSQDV